VRAIKGRGGGSPISGFPFWAGKRGTGVWVEGAGARTEVRSVPLHGRVSRGGRADGVMGEGQ